MLGALAPAPKVDDEPIATTVTGLPAATRSATRLRGLLKWVNSGGTTHAAADAPRCPLAGLIITVAKTPISALAVRNIRKNDR
jgi:hypothetical protein